MAAKKRKMKPTCRQDILETDHYLPWPTKFDIHEYSIMERFCRSIDDDDRRDGLLNTNTVGARFAASKTAFTSTVLPTIGTSIATMPYERLPLRGVRKTGFCRRKGAS